MEKQKILIVDDSEMNRALLTDILEGQYDVRDAENGMRAVEILGENETDFWLVLLDIMMPEMDGFGVLNYINKQYWNDRVVVMMISSDDSPENINRAYSLGAFDYISRPFDPMIVRKRIANTMFLFARQHDLEKAMQREFLEHQKTNDLMVSILSHIVEFRNGESGLHVQNVKNVTELLLRRLIQLTDKYSLSSDDIMLISMASAMHDIGKISIPEEILNKPGRLTPEEFAIMKTHSEIGARMISDLPIEQFSSPLAKVSYEICRWHHERYDGRGYPDGLKGDEIPISAQVVAMADVYDALTSERCYKKAFSHEEALKMILEGTCGAFNPILLRCLKENGDKLKRLYENKGLEHGQNAAAKTEEKIAPNLPKQDDSREYMQLLYIDSVTEVYNRRYYKEFIQNSSDIEGVIVVDVNHLRQINEAYGRETGDRVLHGVARKLLTLIQRNDHVIRYSGNEFLIIFKTIEESAFGKKLEKICESFENLTIDGCSFTGQLVKVSGVYGVENTEALFRMGENIMERSKYMNKQTAGSSLDVRAEDGDNDLNQEEETWI